MSIIIRNAVKEDCKAMMDLIHELALYEKGPDEVTVDFDHFVESGFGENPVWWAFVAEASPNPSEGGGQAENALTGKKAITEKEESILLSDQMNQASTPEGGEQKENVGEVIGFALWYIRYSTWKGQRLYLEDLLVTDSMRGKGIGGLLFDKLIEECKAKKYSGMMWQVLDWNEPAINFYKKYNANLDGEWINGSLNF